MATAARNQASTPVLPPHMDRNDLKALEAISTASIGPADAYFVVRGILQKDDRKEVLEAAYEALRGVVFQFVASRVIGEQLDLWADVVLRIKGLFRTRSEAFSERFTVLADFLEQASRRVEFQPTDELRRRKHVRTILTLLAETGGPTERSRIIEATGLKDANLSRILGNLVTQGWIARQPIGRELLVSITPEGRREGLADQPAAVSGTGPFESATALRILQSIWGQSGASVAMSSTVAGILACDPKFASLLGFADPSSLIGQSSEIVRQRLAEMSTGADEVAPDEVMLADGTHHRIVEHTLGESSLWLGFDITPYKHRIDAYSRRESALVSELDNLRREAKARTKSVTRRDPIFADHLVEQQDLVAYLGAIRNDLLSPLTAINNASYLMRHAFAHKIPLADSFIEQIDVVSRESDRVRTVLRDFLHLGANVPLAVSSFVPAAVVRDVASSLAYTERAQEQFLDLSLNLDEAIETDEMLFRSTVMNAVTGVMRMTPSRSRIGIETVRVDDTIQLLVRGFGAAGGYEVDLVPAARFDSFNLCRHAVARIGGECRLESSRHGLVAHISVPIMKRLHSDW